MRRILVPGVLDGFDLVQDAARHLHHVTDLRFNVAYEVAVGLEFFVGRIRSALDNAETPAMAVLAVEHLERNWSAHAAELRRRLMTRMAPDKRALFANVDNL